MFGMVIWAGGLWLAPNQLPPVTAADVRRFVPAPHLWHRVEACYELALARRDFAARAVNASYSCIEQRRDILDHANEVTRAWWLLMESCRPCPPCPTDDPTDREMWEAEHQWLVLDALSDLRDLIGSDAYYRGEMPPPIPLGRSP